MLNSVYLITGGSSGIGLGVLEALSADGAVCYSISRNAKRISEAKKGLSAKGASVKFFEGDVTNNDDVSRVCDEILKRHGHLNGLVNCAGTICSGGIETGTLEDWRKVLEANLTGTYLPCKLALPLLKKAKTASIVNISSVCSLRPCSSLAYSVSKAGVDMMTKCMAKDLASCGIRVNAVNPGVVRSNLQVSAGIVSNYEEFLEKMKTQHPLGRVGTPSDIASIVRFLLSENASWITGAIISVDGGRAL
jgi:NAD(P)-dependent dehydrogenase (short-subunit alcohol dehydrogenase family)